MIKVILYGILGVVLNQAGVGIMSNTGYFFAIVALVLLIDTAQT